MLDRSNPSPSKPTTPKRGVEPGIEIPAMMQPNKKRGDFADRYGLRDLGEALKNVQSNDGVLDSSSSSPAPSSSAAQTSTPSGTERVYRTLAGILARWLRKEEKGRGKLFPFLEEFGVAIDEILPAARWMESKGYVRVLEKPPTGNWSLELTPKAAELHA